jgi:antagonist of KipI
MLKVIKPGIFTTIQDAGRVGFQQYGIIVSGAIDRVAYRIGNALLNQHNKAALEMTLIGGVYRFTKQSTIVLTGGQMMATLNDKPIHMYQPVPVKAGDLLKCGVIQSGMRSYLCITGGFLVEEVLNSSSTYLRAELGGYYGRRLQAGDCLSYEELASNHTTFQYNASAFYTQEPIRILKGSEWDQFRHHEQESFLKQSYSISVESDRMGYRLQGQQPISINNSFQLLSEAVTFGTVQLPPSGQPIVLMVDRQTTGGYPKIAQIITADLHRFSQLSPKQTVQFELVTIEQAEESYFQLEQQLRLLELLISHQ